MVKFKNMKIPVENNLDEIVATLESKGCWFNMGDGNDTLAEWVILCLPSGRYDIYNNNRHVGDWAKTITLAEIRSMNIETLKEM